MPGRIAGETRTSTVAAVSCSPCRTREQHIRREKATSNIYRPGPECPGRDDPPCLAQRSGGVELGQLLARRTATPEADRFLDGFELLHDAPVVREFAVRSERPVDELLPLGDESDGPAPRLPVYPLGRDYPEYEDAFLVAITENRPVDEIGWLAHMLEHGQAGWGEIHDHDDQGNPVDAETQPDFSRRRCGGTR